MKCKNKQAAPYLVTLHHKVVVVVQRLKSQFLFLQGDDFVLYLDGVTMFYILSQSRFKKNRNITQQQTYENVVLFYFFIRVCMEDDIHSSSNCTCHMWIKMVKTYVGMKSPFSSSRVTTVQNLDLTRQTTDITHFAVVFHDVISI